MNRESDKTASVFPDAADRSGTPPEEALPDLEHATPEEMRGLVLRYYRQCIELGADNAELRNYCDELEEGFWRRTVDLEKTVLMLREELARRERTEETLRNWRENLEDLVAERTVELAEVNSRLVREKEERKQFEESLRESEERFRAILENSLDAAYRRDLIADRYDYVSPVIEQITGLSADEFCALSLDAIIKRIHPGDRGAMAETVGKILRGECPSGRIEYRFRGKKGNYCWIADNFKDIPDENGAPRYLIGVVRDITDKKKGERALRESEERFRLLAENSTDMIVRLAPDDTYRYVSPASRALLGYDPEELAGHSAYEFIHPDDRRKVDGFHARILQKNTPETISYRIRRKDGGYIWFETTGRAIRDPRTGKVREIQASSRDITGWVQAETSLRESEEGFRALAENANAVIGIVQGRKFVYVNPYFEAISGYSMEEIYSSEISRFVHPDDREMILDRARRRQAGEPVETHYEFRMLTKSGETRWIDFSPSRVMLKGEPAIAGVGVDITERTRAEEALRGSEVRERARSAELETVLDAVPAAVWIAHDPHGLLITGNRLSYEWLGLPVGANPSKTAPGGDHLDTFRLYKDGVELQAGEMPVQVSASGVEIRNYEFDIVYPDGSVRHLLGNATPLFDERGKPRGSVSAFMDITERKRADKALRESEEIMRYIVKHDPNAIAVYDKDLRYLAVSDRFLRDYNVREAGDIIGRRHYDVFPELPERWKEVHARCLRGVVERNEDDYFVRPDGSITYNRWECRPWYRANGEIAGMIIYSEVTTERKKAEMALRESEERFRRIVETAEEGIWLTDADDRTIFVNARLTKMLGYGEEEMMGRSPLDFVEAADREKRTSDLDMRRRGIPERNDFRYRRKDGGEIWAIVSIAPILDRDGRYAGSLAMITDITERHRVEEALRLSEERFRAAVDYFPGVFIVYDAERRILFMNREGIRKSGHPLEEAIGRRDEDMFPPEVTSRYVPALLRAIETREKQILEALLPAPEKNYWVLMNVVPLLTGQGDIWQILIISLDISERKEAEERVRTLNERLRRQAEQLAAANREMEAFSYSVSHDLRAPLRSIDGFSAALLEDYADKLDEEGRDSLERIRAAAQRMGHLIDDLLNLSRASRAEIRQKTVDLSALAREILDELHKADPDREVERLVPEGITGEGDPDLLRQALDNLLRNAWKFTSKTPQARIEFGTLREDGLTVYFVRDNGAGFDMRYSERLFVPFRRLHTEDEFPGTGIGLSIVSRIVHRHGGEIWAEGAVGKGAAVYFTLHAQRPAPNAESEREPALSGP